MQNKNEKVQLIQALDLIRKDCIEVFRDISTYETYSQLLKNISYDKTGFSEQTERIICGIIKYIRNHINQIEAEKADSIEKLNHQKKILKLLEKQHNELIEENDKNNEKLVEAQLETAELKKKNKTINRKYIDERAFNEDSDNLIENLREEIKNLEQENQRRVREKKNLQEEIKNLKDKIKKSNERFIQEHQRSAIPISLMNLSTIRELYGLKEKTKEIIKKYNKTRRILRTKAQRNNVSEQLQKIIENFQQIRESITPEIKEIYTEQLKEVKQAIEKSQFKLKIIDQTGGVNNSTIEYAVDSDDSESESDTEESDIEPIQTETDAHNNNASTPQNSPTNCTKMAKLFDEVNRRINDQIPIFTGLQGTVTITQFLEQCDYVLESLGTEETAKQIFYKGLRSRFRGTAYELINANKIETYTELKSVLKRSYDHQHSIPELEEMFITCSQMSNESILGYYTRISNILTQIQNALKIKFPADNKALLDSQEIKAVNIFKRGVYNLNLKQYLLIIKTSKLKEIWETATEYEELAQEVNIKTPVEMGNRRTEVPIRAEIRTVGEADISEKERVGESNIICYACGGKGHYAGECANTQKRVRNNIANNQNGYNGYNNRNTDQRQNNKRNVNNYEKNVQRSYQPTSPRQENQMRTRNKQTEKKCLYCKLQGHFTDDCFYIKNMRHCYKCRSTEHTGEECSSRNGGRNGYNQMKESIPYQQSHQVPVMYAQQPYYPYYAQQHMQQQQGLLNGFYQPVIQQPQTVQHPQTESQRPPAQPFVPATTHNSNGSGNGKV